MAPGEDLVVLVGPMEARLRELVARLKGRVMAVKLSGGLVTGCSGQWLGPS